MPLIRVHTNMKKLFCIIILFLLIPFQLFAATLYVTQSGAGNGTSYAQADSIYDFNVGNGEFASLDGDTVYICDTIETSITVPDGGADAGNRVTIRGDLADHAFVKNYSTGTAAILISSKNYVTIQGFTIIGTYQRGIKFLNSTYGEVDDCDISGTSGHFEGAVAFSSSDYGHVHDTTVGPQTCPTCGENDTEGIYFTLSDYGLVEDSIIHDIGGHGAIEWHESDYFVLRNNTVYESGVNSADPNHMVDQLISAIKGSNYSVVENNTMYESENAINDEHLIGWKIHESGYHIFWYNTLYNIDNMALQSYTRDRKSVV